MAGDLPGLVLEAARKEKGKANGHPEAGREGSGDQRTSSQTNGHLAAPFEWRGPASGNDRMTASPEPIHRELSSQATPSSEQPAATSPTRAKKRSVPPTRPQQPKGRQSSFFGARSEHAAAKQAAKKLYTSESTREDDEQSDATNQPGTFGERHLDTEAQSHRAPGYTADSSPMRGPFSRLDSSRGQSMLQQGNAQAGPSVTQRQIARRQSTGLSGHRQGSGDDSRRVSLSGGHRLGVMTENDETTADEYESHDELAADRSHASYFETSGRQLAPGESPQQGLSRAASGSVNGAHTPQRRNSVRSFSRPFGRSTNRQDTGDQSGQEEQPNSSRPPLNKGYTQAEGTLGKKKWAALKQRLKQEKKPEELDKSLTGTEMITDLSSGMMSIMMLKMAFDRDEHDKHRIPVLLNYLKLRITDSVYPFHNAHAIFRIELEYGDGLLKWVVYRELRDFVNLHTHYRVANVKHAVDRFPTFPKVSIPYFNVLKKESKEKGASVPGKAEFARMQREALETYLLKLIRAVMFRPEANRLCKFFELSAMSIALAKRGGSQGKQGYLRVMSGQASRHKRAGFHPLDLKSRHEPKWFVVRESYIVSTDEPCDTKVWDCFLIDSDFEIERPRRLYRQGIGLFAESKQKAVGPQSKGEEKEKVPEGASEYAGAEGFSGGGVGDPNDPSTTNMAQDDPKYLKNASAHTFYIKNSERRVKLVAKTERQMDQFIASIEKMVEKSIWAGNNRFGSFAPIRLNVAAQWLVDGRDYYWNLSRAILLAKEKIYIHDWWLSPELYLRRPPAENGRWRLDRLLQRKAEEGVQIFIIVYKEVSNDFTPVDSNYTKSTLAGLHPNIMVQRSPDHAQTRTLLWSHHEKMCVIDETIGFMGGLDLCFGRWDTPSHLMVDDGEAVTDDLDLPGHEHKGHGHDRESTQIWPGKDYANSRISDFKDLNKPFEDMFDRAKTPREPWHDIGLQIIGQPARDLCRHFTQRWNLLLRNKNHRRFMPFLLPAPDFTAKELRDLQLTGTCEVQICRSAGPWSIGTPNRIEHSIQTAYIKAIQMSDHFVYIENQFFITSTAVGGTAIENNIGNALVARIQQAHAEGTAWRAVIIIPLEPGYPMPVDHPDAGSVRLIMECQFSTISRGEHSIFARLRRDGIDPNEYISFYSLRSWSRMQDGTLATMGIYIHAKCMVVDDRIAIIGSANINERSQRGDRDSELACVIRDTDMVDSTMAGKPYKVGRFAHTLRIRLMREHLGVDVDALEEEEATMDLLERDPVKDEDDVDVWDPRKEQKSGSQGITSEKKHRTRAAANLRKAGDLVGETAKGAGEAIGIGAQSALPNVSEDLAHAAPGHSSKGQNKGTTITEEGEPTPGDRIVTGEADGQGTASTVVPTLEEKMIGEDRPDDGEQSKGEDGSRSKGEQNMDPSHDNEGHDKPGEGKAQSNLGSSLGKTTTQTGNEKRDVSDTRQLAKHQESSEKTGTPDDVQGAHQAGDHYDDIHDVKEHEKQAKKAKTVDRGQRTEAEDSKNRDTTRHRHTRFDSSATMTSVDSATTMKGEAETGGKVNKSNEQTANSNKANDTIRKGLAGKMNAYSLPTKAPKVDPKAFADPLIDDFYKDVWMAAAVRNTQIFRKVFRCTPDDLVTTWAMMKEWSAWGRRHEKPLRGSAPHTADSLRGGPGAPPAPDEEPSSGSGHPKSASETNHEAELKKRAKKQVEEAFTEEEVEQMMTFLEETTGNLVVYPMRFLEGESAGQNFLWSKDRIPPIAIYN